MIVIDAQSKDFLDLITAISTALAVIFAAFSSWISMKSAKAAKDTVEEARLSRRAELAPRLVLEKDFFDFKFYWPHADSLNGEAVFLSRKHWKDDSPAPPVFNLQNFGASPALEVTIIWELEDSNDDYVIPEAYMRAGISLAQSGDIMEDGRPLLMVEYSKQSGGGTGLPLYRRWTVDIPSCSPGQNRKIELPIYILNVLFIRGLQMGATSRNIVLAAHISCYSVDGELYERVFKWNALPFSYRELSPVIVYGHFNELAIHPKPIGPRVL